MSEQRQAALLAALDALVADMNQNIAPTPGGVKMNFRNGLEAMTPTWQVECGDLRGSFRARSVAAVLARALLAHHRLSPLVRFRRPTGPGRWIWQYQETAHLLRQHREER